MIVESLEFIASELNTFFKSKLAIAEDKVIVSNIINPDGSFPDFKNKLAVCLINLEKETGLALPGFRTNAGQAIHNQPLAINLQVLLAACFEDYTESLSFISDAFVYFYTNPIFLQNSHPNIGERIGQLSIVLQPANYEMTNQLWSSLGAKHVPYLLYKVSIQVVLK